MDKESNKQVETTTHTSTYIPTNGTPVNPADKYTYDMNGRRITPGSGGQIGNGIGNGVWPPQQHIPNGWGIGGNNGQIGGMFPQHTHTNGIQDSNRMADSWKITPEMISAMQNMTNVNLEPVKRLGKTLVTLMRGKGRNNYKTSFVIEQACVLASHGKIVLLLVKNQGHVKTIQAKIKQEGIDGLSGNIIVMAFDQAEMGTRGLHYDTVLIDPDVFLDLLEKLS